MYTYLYNTVKIPEENNFQTQMKAGYKKKKLPC